MNDQNIKIYGRLGKNPELRRSKNNKSFCTFSIAEEVPGEKTPRWHNIVIWEKDSEHWAKTLKKGTGVFVQGRMKVREFRTQNGEIKIYREINAQELGLT